MFDVMMGMNLPRIKGNWCQTFSLIRLFDCSRTFRGRERKILQSSLHISVSLGTHSIRGGGGRRCYPNHCWSWHWRLIFTLDCECFEWWISYRRFRTWPSPWPSSGSSWSGSGTRLNDRCFFNKKKLSRQWKANRGQLWKGPLASLKRLPTPYGSQSNNPPTPDSWEVDERLKLANRIKFLDFTYLN